MLKVLFSSDTKITELSCEARTKDFPYLSNVLYLPAFHMHR